MADLEGKARRLVRMEQPRTLKIQSSTLATSSEIERRRVKDRLTSAASVHLVHLERRGACLLLEPLDSIQAPRVAKARLQIK